MRYGKWGINNNQYPWLTVCGWRGELTAPPGIFVWVAAWLVLSFPDDSAVKNPPANAGDTGSIPGLGRSPGGGNGNLFQYSCLKNRMNRGAWWAPVHGVAKDSDMTEGLGTTVQKERFG